MAAKKQTYPCYRCSGEGQIRAFGHVLGGVCFACKGSGRQTSRPSRSVLWAVLDTAGQPVYNVKAKNDKEAIQRALAVFARAQASTNPEAVAFVAEHDMTSPAAFLAEEYWTEERRARLST